ncbi:MAG: hypothetical protein V4498_07350, partial [candidate division FCPU426 bacterium]
MQMKKSIAPSEPADLDIGPMNISKINVDSAVAGVVAGVATSISDSLTPFRDGTGHIAVSRVDADSAILRRLEVNNTCRASKLIVDDDGARFPYLGDGPLAQSGGDLTVLGTTGTDDVV